MKKVMIVDDELAILSLFEVLFEDRGYEAVVANSAEEALEALTSDVAVVLADVQMEPGKDGIWLLSEIRKRNKDVAVILMSAGVQSSTINKASSLGATAFVEKPFKWRDLMHQISTYLQTDGGINAQQHIA